MPYTIPHHTQLPWSLWVTTQGDISPHQPWGLEAVVLPKITAPLPAFPIPFNPHWKHLTGLCLADRDFSVPGPVDVLLGADVVSRIMLHGQRSGPSRTSSTLEMHFGLVLSGKTHLKCLRQPAVPVFLPSHKSGMPTSCGTCLYEDIGKQLKTLGVW